MDGRTVRPSVYSALTEKLGSFQKISLKKKKAGHPKKAG